MGGAQYALHYFCVCTCTQLRIGRTGSRGDIGVVAREDIPQGTLLAVVPRHTILNGASSRVGATMLSDRAFRRQMKTMNSWVPLLLALLAECGHKVSLFCSCIVYGFYLSSGPAFGAPTCPWFQIKPPPVLFYGGLPVRGDGCWGAQEWRRGYRETRPTSVETTTPLYCPSHSVTLNSSSEIYSNQQQVCDGLGLFTSGSRATLSSSTSSW